MRIPWVVLNKYIGNKNNGSVIEIQSGDKCYCFEKITKEDTFESEVEISIQDDSSTGKEYEVDRGIEDFKLSKGDGYLGIRN